MNPNHQLAAALADRYRIEGELGQGGMATVYLAQDLKPRRRGVGEQQPVDTSGDGH